MLFCVVDLPNDGDQLMMNKLKHPHYILFDPIKLYGNWDHHCASYLVNYSDNYIQVRYDGSINYWKDYSFRKYSIANYKYSGTKNVHSNKESFVHRLDKCNLLIDISQLHII